MGTSRTIANPCSSIIVRRAGRAKKRSETYQLSPEELGELQQEGIQYYHRYISLFPAERLRGRDPRYRSAIWRCSSLLRNMRSSEDLAWSVEQFTPYVLMMNTRAKASIEMEREDFAAAVGRSKRAWTEFVRFTKRPRMRRGAANSPELSFSSEWLEEVRARQPLTKLEKMQREMDRAIAQEAYERAAELRDQIKAITARKH